MILTARDIAQQLASRVEAYARWLLPNGHMDSGNWCAGSVQGEAGNSLRVQVAGGNAGVWADFAGDDRGDLLNLTAAVRGVRLGEAIRIAKEWLGIRDPQNLVPKKAYAVCKPKGLIPVQDQVLAYLADVRKIDIFTQEAFRIQQSISDKHGPEIVFPYHGPDGELKNVKRLALQRTENGKKIIRQETGCAPTLFGWQALSITTREVLICEGEIDCLTWHQMGFPALSIPDGAKGDTWIDVEWDNLQRFDTIYLNWDNDIEGQKAVREFARRLGLHRCLLVTIPGHKDANEALQAGADEHFFHAAIGSARALDPEQIKTPAQFYDRVCDRFHPPDGKLPGFYSALFGGKLGMRPAEVSVWSGIAGHGKSTVLSQLMMEAVKGGFKVAIASMELRGERTLHRMLCQAEKVTSLTNEQIDAALNWLTGKLWIYDVIGTVSPKLLLELMEYSYARHGVRIFVIDSLMKCQVGQDDYDGQRVFLNQLYQFSNETDTHVNLVAHSRKGNNETDHPGKLDVLGSSTIINQASNILVVCRNKAKEERMRERNAVEPDDSEPDAIVYCNKQNENGEEFMAKLLHRRFIFRFEHFDSRMDMNLRILGNSNGEPEQPPIQDPPDEPDLPYHDP